MSRRHRDRDASPLFLVATAAYTANCALGASVAARPHRHQPVPLAASRALHRHLRDRRRGCRGRLVPRSPRLRSPSRPRTAPRGRTPRRDPVPSAATAAGIHSSRSPRPPSSSRDSSSRSAPPTGSDRMELLDAIRRRKTTNGPFLPDPVSEEHQRILLEAAGRAPSQLNSQPWRFVVIESRDTIEQIARISGESMTEAMSNGRSSSATSRTSASARPRWKRSAAGCCSTSCPPPSARSRVRCSPSAGRRS